MGNKFPPQATWSLVRSAASVGVNSVATSQHVPVSKGEVSLAYVPGQACRGWGMPFWHRGCLPPVPDPQLSSAALLSCYKKHTLGSLLRGERAGLRITRVMRMVRTAPHRAVLRFTEGKAVEGSAQSPQKIP